MTRKDYNKMVECLMKSKGSMHEDVFARLVKDFGVMLQSDNPAFSWDKWMEAFK